MTGKDLCSLHVVDETGDVFYTPKSGKLQVSKQSHPTSKKERSVGSRLCQKRLRKRGDDSP